MKAIWKGEIIAQSEQTVVVEGNHYFPVGAVNMDHLTPSDKETFCPWKGVAKYYSVRTGGELNSDACWYYPEPKEAAENIRDHVAFWKGVEVTD